MIYGCLARNCLTDENCYTEYDFSQYNDNITFSDVCGYYAHSNSTNYDCYCIDTEKCENSVITKNIVSCLLIYFIICVLISSGNFLHLITINWIFSVCYILDFHVSEHYGDVLF